MWKDVSKLRRPTAGYQGKRCRIELADKRQQCVGEERVRDTSLNGVSAADCHAPTFPVSSIHSGHSEPSLPYSALTDNEDRASCSLRALINGFAEQGKLGIAADQRCLSPFAREHCANVRTSVYGSQPLRES